MTSYQISGANLTAIQSIAEKTETNANATVANINALIQGYIALQIENVELRAKLKSMGENTCQP